MFTKAGDFPVTITQAVLAEPKFAQAPAFDVALEVKTDDGQCDWWRGEISANYGKGRMSDRTQAQITMQTLEDIGWQGEWDWSRIEELVGTKTTAHVEEGQSKEGRTFFNVKWIGGGARGVVAIDKASIAARMQAIIDGSGAAPAMPTAAPAPSVAPAVAPKPTRSPFVLPAQDAKMPDGATATKPFAAPKPAVGNPFARK